MNLKNHLPVDFNATAANKQGHKQKDHNNSDHLSE